MENSCDYAIFPGIRKKTKAVSIYGQQQQEGDACLPNQDLITKWLSFLAGSKVTINKKTTTSWILTKQVLRCASGWSGWVP